MKKSFKLLVFFAAALIIVGCGKKGKDGDASDSKSKKDTVYVEKKQKADASETKEAEEVIGDAQAPDFTLESLDGSMVSLSDFEGSYVVLDFWGSWCYYCMKGMPKMKQYYEKYGDKIAFVGIDCQDSKSAWKKAVAENGLEWTQLYVPNGSDLTEQYAIEGFPTKMILDKHGRVIAVTSGEDPSFYNELDELMSL